MLYRTVYRTGVYCCRIVLFIHVVPVSYIMHTTYCTDTECAQVKAENIILRREKEASALEMRKLKGTASFSGERLSTTESEARRIKAQAQVRRLGRLSVVFMATTLSQATVPFHFCFL